MICQSRWRQSLQQMTIFQVELRRLDVFQVRTFGRYFNRKETFMLSSITQTKQNMSFLSQKKKGLCDLCARIDIDIKASSVVPWISPVCVAPFAHIMLAFAADVDSGWKGRQSWGERRHQSISASTGSMVNREARLHLPKLSAHQKWWEFVLSCTVSSAQPLHMATFLCIPQRWSWSFMGH